MINFVVLIIGFCLGVVAWYLIDVFFFEKEEDKAIKSLSNIDTAFENYELNKKLLELQYKYNELEKKYQESTDMLISVSKERDSLGLRVQQLEVDKGNLLDKIREDRYEK